VVERVLLVALLIDTAVQVELREGGREGGEEGGWSGKERRGFETWSSVYSLLPSS